MTQLEFTFYEILAVIGAAILAWLYTKPGKKWLASL